MDFKALAKQITEYNARSTDDIRAEVCTVINTYKLKQIPEFCKQVGISKDYFYCLRKDCCNCRPSFELYVKIMAIGPNPIQSNPVKHTRKKRTDTQRKYDYKQYQHDYYLRVTKIKRAEKRKNENSSNS